MKIQDSSSPKRARPQVQDGVLSPRDIAIADYAAREACDLVIEACAEEAKKVRDIARANATAFALSNPAEARAAELQSRGANDCYWAIRALKKATGGDTRGEANPSPPPQEGLVEALEAILHTYDEGGVPLARAFQMANAALSHHRAGVK